MRPAKTTSDKSVTITTFTYMLKIQNAKDIFCDEIRLDLSILTEDAIVFSDQKVITVYHKFYVANLFSCFKTAVGIWSTKLKVNSTVDRKLLIKEDPKHLNRLCHYGRILFVTVQKLLFNHFPQLL